MKMDEETTKAQMAINDATIVALGHLDTKLDNIMQKYVPVSEKRLHDLWTAVRETIDDFSNQLVGFQYEKKTMNDKIDTLSAMVDNLTQQVVMLSVTAPQDTTESVNDIGMRLLVLEQQNVSSGH